MSDLAQVIVGPSESNVVETYARPQEAELVNWVESLRDEAFTALSEQAGESRWRDSEKGFWGDHWPDIVPSYKPPIVANEMQTLILSELSDLTDSPMKIYVQKDPAHGDRDECDQLRCVARLAGRASISAVDTSGARPSVMRGVGSHGHARYLTCH